MYADIRKKLGEKYMETLSALCNFSLTLDLLRRQSLLQKTLFYIFSILNDFVLKDLGTYAFNW